MTLVLMAVGLLATAAGFITIGFGIPINAFSIGNTLIISGTIAVASGLVLIGISLVLGQLKRIAEALRGSPQVYRAGEPAEAAVPPAPRLAVSPVPASTRALAEVTRSETPPAEPPRPPEPRFPATASEPAAGPLDWLRAKAKPTSATATGTLAAPPEPPPIVELTDEAPLSPRPPQRPAMPPVVEPALDPKIWSPSRDAGAPGQQSGPRSEQPTPRATSPGESLNEKEKERFDLVWPDRAPPSGPGDSHVEAKREPAVDMPLPPIPARPRESRPAEKRMPEFTRKVAERGPAILKSGVIDGMPYTLYADGSIEAQLPQGMVKFASVDALRAHLEKQG